MANIAPTTGPITMTQLANSFNITSVTNRTLSSFRSLGNVGAPDGTPTTFTAASGRNSGTTDNFIGRDAVSSFGQNFNYLNGDLYYLHIFSEALAATDHSLLTSW